MQHGMMRQRDAKASTMKQHSRWMWSMLLHNCIQCCCTRALAWVVVWMRMMRDLTSCDDDHTAGDDTAGVFDGGYYDSMLVC